MNAMSIAQRQPSRRSQRALDWANFFLADVSDDIGPYLGIYLMASYHWHASYIGIAMGVAHLWGDLGDHGGRPYQGHWAARRNLIAGFVVDATSYDGAFLFLAVSALLALAVFYFGVPETINGKTKLGSLPEPSPSTS